METLSLLDGERFRSAGVVRAALHVRLDGLVVDKVVPQPDAGRPSFIFTRLGARVDVSHLLCTILVIIVESSHCPGGYCFWLVSTSAVFGDLSDVSWVTTSALGETGSRMVLRKRHDLIGIDSHLDLVEAPLAQGCS